MKPYPSKPFAFFWYYMRQYRWLTLGTLVGIALMVVCAKLVAYIFSAIIDKVGSFNSFSTDVWHQTMPLLILLLCIGIAGGVVRRLAMACACRISPAMYAKIKQDMTAYILNHATAFLINQPAGKLAERVGQLAGHTSRFFWMLLFGFYKPFIEITMTIVMFGMINIWFAGNFIFWMVLLAVMLILNSIKTKKYAKALADKDAEATGVIVDSISNSLVVKSFGNFGFEDKKINEKLQEVRRFDQSFGFRIENSRAWQTIVIAVYQVSMMVIALWLWQKGKVSAGNIVLVLLLINDISGFFTRFLHDLLDFHRTLGVLGSALQVVSTPHQMSDKENAVKLKIKKATVEFRHVDFAYGQKALFKNFSLKIKAGEKVGLVGISGSGKSTFVNLLQRFFDVNEGSVLIDGQDVRSVSQESLHKNIAVVPQDTALFNRTLEENIAYGKPMASHKEIVQAAKKAFAHDFICQTANGYHSLVGDKGVKLSGGQRQRIALARAFLKNAPILVLDEATSALDSQSEYFIQKSIKELMKGKTTIAIAHRLSTLKEMDRIIVMRRGKIVEDGSPSVLLKKKGPYAKLWKMQTEMAAAPRADGPEMKSPIG